LAAGPFEGRSSTFTVTVTRGGGGSSGGSSPARAQQLRGHPKPEAEVFSLCFVGGGKRARSHCATQQLFLNFLQTGQSGWTLCVVFFGKNGFSEKNHRQKRPPFFPVIFILF